MQAKLISIGNSRGIRLPKAIIAQAGLKDDVDIAVSAGAVVIRPARATRAGWAEAAKKCHANGDDGALLDGLTNAFDAEW
jgi:antitoxin MazE